MAKVKLKINGKVLTEEQLNTKMSDLEAFTIWYLCVGLNLIFAIAIGLLNIPTGRLYILLTTILSAIHWFKIGRKQC